MQVAGTKVKLAEGSKLQTGVGRIQTSTSTLAATDQASHVVASDVGMRGVVSRASSRSIKVEGSLSREAIQRVVQQHLGQIRACYERELPRNPSMSGKIIARWTIAADGSVLQAAAPTDSLGHPATTSCVLSAIRGWDFPHPEGGAVTVSYPFNFTSSGA